jgi:ATP-dependent Clp protease ATP-binding subunit ClpC
MTSNIGAELIKSQSGFGFGKKTPEANYEKMKEMLQKEVERHFRPEFLNRLDDTIVFKSLTSEGVQTTNGTRFEAGVERPGQGIPD